MHQDTSVSKQILIIEDSGSFRMVVKVALERSGYDVMEASSADKACTMLDGRTINLIVCDLNMPGMDGLSFVKHLRTTDYKFTPVVMLTTESTADKKSEASALGVKAWITKPFQPTQLVDAISKICAA